jgi:hypothetical protein
MLAKCQGKVANCVRKIFVRTTIGGAGPTSRSQRVGGTKPAGPGQTALGDALGVARSTLALALAQLAH